MEYIANTYGRSDIYPSDHIITGRHGDRCIITDDRLYDAMLSLDEELREVLIQKFWNGLSSKEIAKQFCVTEKTIYNWKRKAFKKIRLYYERN